MVVPQSASRKSSSIALQPEETEQVPDLSFSNPPVIQDKPLAQNILEENEEETNQNNLEEVTGEENPEVLDISKEKPTPESDNQLNSVQKKNNFDSSEETDGSISTDNGVLEDNVIPLKTPLQNLENSIFEVVEDSIKAASNTNNNVLREIEDIEENAGNRESVIEEANKGEKIGQTAPDQGIEGNEEEILVPEELEPNEDNLGEANKEIIEEPEEIVNNNEDRNEATIGERIPQEIEADEAKIEEKVDEITPDLQNRNKFTSPDVSNYHNFGSLVPVGDLKDPQVQKVFFVGKNINLPLQMYKTKDGTLELAVDMEKLCHCKNENCTRKHQDDIIGNPEITIPESRRFQRNSADLMDLIDEVVQNESSDIAKRSPRIEDNREDYDETYKINEGYKFENEANLEDKLEKLERDVEQFRNKNEKLLNKGTVALFKNEEKTKKVDRMVDLAGNVLNWMKKISEEQDMSNAKL